MPTTLFDFTYNLATEASQNAVLSAIAAAKKKEYEPISHFFTDATQLALPVAGNLGTDAFGPVLGAETTKYRTTSIVRASGTNPVKVFAICDGQVLIQPQTGDDTKVNLILKPSESYAPLKIKYFIYRGIRKSDLIGMAGSNAFLADHNATDAPDFLKKLWNKFIAFNTSIVDPSTGNPLPAPTEFQSSLIGYDESQSNSTIIEHCFTKKDVSNPLYQVPLCSKGEHLGYFVGEIGLDVVLDFGDYELQNQEELFRLNLNFAKLKNHVFDTSTISSSTATKVKRYKEHIHQFIDIAAFWGSHIECGTIKLHDNPSGIKTNADIFNSIVSKYQTKNKIYVYIQGENNRSYNYYEATRKIFGFNTSGKLNDTSGWPILIEEIVLTTATTTFKEGKGIQLEYNIDSAIPELERHVIVDIISPNNVTSNFPLLTRPKNPSGTLPTVLVDKTPSATILFPVNGTKSCATFLFIYANLKQENPLKNYYNQLWPVNLNTNLNLPLNEINLSSWCTYDKSRIVNLDDVLGLGASIQNKIVFDNGIDQTISGSNPSTKKRRLYIAALKRNSSHDEEHDILNIDTQTAGLSKYTKTPEEYILNLYNDPEFSVFKGSFMDGTTINSVTLFHEKKFTKKNSYFQLGITEEEYNKLIYDSVTIPSPVVQILPQDSDNVFFHLEEVTSFVHDFIKKFKLGLYYENSTGVMTTLFPTSSVNDVFVYTIDGLYFFSKEYSLYQNFAKNHPKCNVDFRVTLPYAGEFGFDWMRQNSTGAPGDVDYKNILGKLYTDAAHTTVVTNINEDSGHFNSIPRMYEKLERDYKPYFIQPSTILKKYYIPILTIYPPYVPVVLPNLDLDRQAIFSAPYNDDINRLAKIKLKVQISNSPDRIELEYDKSIFDIPTITIPTVTGDLDITVRCINEFSNEQIIQAKAYYRDASGYLDTKGVTVGLLRVKPNTKFFRKIKKVLFITVKTNINGVINVPSANDKAKYMMKFLRQTLITPIFESFELDMTVNPTFNSTYVHLNSTASPPRNVIVYKKEAISGMINMHIFLYNFLKTLNIPGTSTPIGGMYDNYYRLFFLGESGGYLDASGTYKGLNGYSSGNNIVGFVSANNATGTHEFLHSAKLPHSFTANEGDKLAKFTYEPWKTDNIMDYSHKVSIDRVSLWDWQAKIANENSDPEP